MDRLPITLAPFAPGESWADDVEDQIQQQKARSLPPIFEAGSEDSDVHETRSTATGISEDSPDPEPVSAHKVGKPGKKENGSTKQAAEAIIDLTKGQDASGERSLTEKPAPSTSSQVPLPDSTGDAPAAPDAAQSKRSWAAVAGTHPEPTAPKKESKLGTPNIAPPSTTITTEEQADPKNPSIHLPVHPPPLPASHHTSVHPSAQFSVQPSVQPSLHPQVGASIMKGRTWAEMAAMKPADWPALSAPSPAVNPAPVNAASASKTASLLRKKHGDGKDAASADPNGTLQSRAEVLKRVSTPPVATASIVTTPSTVATSSAPATFPAATTPPVIGTRAQVQTPTTESKLSATANPFTPGDRAPAPSPPSMPSRSIDRHEWAVPVEEAFNEPSLIRPPPKGPPGFIPGGIVGYTQGVQFTIGEIPLPPGVTHQQLWDEFQQTNRASTASEEPPHDEIAMSPPLQPRPRPHPGTSSPETVIVEKTRRHPPPPRAYAEVANAGIAVPPISCPYSRARTTSPDSATIDTTKTATTPSPHSTSPSETSLPSPISPATFQPWEPLLAREGDRYVFFGQDGRVQTLQDGSNATLEGLRMPGTLYTIHKRDGKGVVVLMGEPRLCDMQGIMKDDGEAADSSLLEQTIRDMVVATSPRDRCHAATQTYGGRPVSKATSPCSLPTIETSDATVQTGRVKTESTGTSADAVEILSRLTLGDSRPPSLAEPSPRDTTSFPAVGPLWGPPEPVSSGSSQNVSITPTGAAVQPEESNTQTSLNRGDTGETPPRKKKTRKQKKKKKAKRASEDEVPNASASSNSATENIGLDPGSAARSGDERKEGNEKPPEEEQKEVLQTLWARARAYSSSWLLNR